MCLIPDIEMHRDTTDTLRTDEVDLVCNKFKIMNCHQSV